MKSVVAIGVSIQIRLGRSRQRPTVAKAGLDRMPGGDFGLARLPA
jgi:hypothetical protein